MAEPVLYSFRRCPYAMRARMALLVSETAFDIREVKLSAKPPEMLASSPKGTVPILVPLDGRVIDESLAIMRWALARHDPERWLDGDDSELIAANDGAFKRDLDRYKYPERHAVDPLTHRASGLAWLMTLEARLARRPWLCGETRSLTDAALMPFVRQFMRIDPAWFDVQSLPKVQNWLAAQIDSALFGQVMLRFAPWRADDAPISYRSAFDAL